MNGAYGVGLAAFSKLGEIAQKGFWIVACVAGALVALWILRKWSDA